MELRDRELRVQALALVGRHRHGLARESQPRGDVLVGRVRPLAGVDHEYDRVRLLDRAKRLAGDRFRHGVRLVGESAGVDRHVGAGFGLREPVIAIPGDAGLVGDEGVPGARQAVEEGRFADVRPSDDGDDRQQGKTFAGLVHDDTGWRVRVTRVSRPRAGGDY